jgi:ATP-binding cassette, subfamily B, multidrug efflux pump
MANHVGQPAGNMAFDKPKGRSIHVLRRLWRYLSKYRMLIALAVIVSVIGNVLALLSPKLSGYAIDAIKPNDVDIPQVAYYVGCMLIISLLSSLMSLGLSYLMISISRKMTKQMRTDLFQQLTVLPVSFFDTHQAGDVISVLSYDVDTVGSSLSTDLVQMLSSIITVVGSFAMMVSISPKLLLIFVFTIPISICFTRIRAKKVRPLFRDRSRKLGELNGFVEETISGLKTVRAYHQEEEFHNRFSEKNDNAVEANWKADYTASVTGPTVNLINNISLALVSIFGSLMYMAGSISLGSIGSFVLYSRKFSGPINEFANILSEIQSALAAAERVLTLCDLPPEKPDKPNALDAAPCKGHVQVQDVSFSYVAGKEILHHITFDAKPGSVIAIVGETGCGKTTLINLLMRFYDVSSGAILLDGKDIRTLKRDSLRSQFTMVLQDTWLFDGTIYDNIAYGRPDAKPEEVIAAAQAAHIHDMILSMPDGYKTPVIASGTSISKGQKQLITIARAMLMNSSMLILDEATSNVDTRTEKLIQDAMLKLMKGRTCFVIAHRLSTITGADCILVMDKGRLVESGTHEELLKKNGYYASMYQAQFDYTA